MSIAIFLEMNSYSGYEWEFSCINVKEWMYYKSLYSKIFCIIHNMASLTSVTI